jgi:hypothetical protein
MRQQTLKQQRQHSLFQAKGQLTQVVTICRSLMYNVSLTPYLRDKAHMAAIELGDALTRFNKEVGWKEKEDAT